MLAEIRKQLILNDLTQNGRVEVIELSKKLDESADTIRRDIRELASAGVLQKVYGGAIPISKAVYPFSEREKQDNEEKEILVKKALDFLLPHQIIALDGGTTNQMLARAIPKYFQAIIITHSPHIALALIDHPHIELILIGGKIFKHSMVSTGSHTLENIQKFHIDIFSLGATGVDEKGGITTGDYEEAEIKAAFVKQSAEILLMATHEKVNKISAFKICDYHKITHLIT